LLRFVELLGLNPGVALGGLRVNPGVGLGETSLNASAIKGARIKSSSRLVFD